MSYRLDVDMRHSIAVSESLRYEIVLRYDVRIVALREAGDVLAGRASFYVIKLGLAIDHDIDVLDVCDGFDQELHEYALALLDSRTGSVREELIERFELVGDDVMVLREIEIEREHRGRDLALVTIDRLIDLFGDGIVLCRPRSPDGADATKRLQRYARRLGFASLDEEADMFALSTATQRRPVKLRPASPSANDNRE